MVAYQLVGKREEGREMVGRELRQDAIIAAEFAIDDDSAAEAQRAQDLVENVHLGGRSGVWVNLYGGAIILPNRAIA